jgi:hypothetical protein
MARVENLLLFHAIKPGERFILLPLRELVKSRKSMTGFSKKDE